MLISSLSNLAIVSPISSIRPSEDAADTNTTKIAFLDKLPTEIFQYLLSYLSTEDIGHLSLVGCSKLRDQVILWIGSISCINRVINGVKFQDLLKSQSSFDLLVSRFKEYGVICKRSSMLFSTNHRLSMLLNWFFSIKHFLSNKLIGCSTLKLTINVAMASTLSTFVLGWDEVEYSKVLKWIKDSVIESDDLSREEFRIFFWECHMNEDLKSSWLSFVLNSTSKLSVSESSEKTAIEMGYLIYYLLGPIHDEDNNNISSLTLNGVYGNINTALMQEVEPSSYDEAKELFSDLGNGLKLLVKNSSFDNLLFTQALKSMFVQMEWLVDNQAACLLFSCEAVIKLHMESLNYESNGVLQISQMVASMLSVCGRFQNDLNSGLASVLEWTILFLDLKDRKEFITEVWKEIVERLEEGTLGVDMLIQFGNFVTKRVNYDGTDLKGKEFKDGFSEAEE